MTAEEKRAKEKEYLEKYNIRVTYSCLLYTSPSPRD